MQDLLCVSLVCDGGPVFHFFAFDLPAAVNLQCEQRGPHQLSLRDRTTEGIKGLTLPPPTP